MYTTNLTKRNKIMPNLCNKDMKLGEEKEKKTPYFGEVKMEMCKLSLSLLEERKNVALLGILVCSFLVSCFACRIGCTDRWRLLCDGVPELII